MQKTFRKDKTPTVYGFACGYTMQQDMYNGHLRVELYMEHTMYHIRLIVLHKVRIWETVDNVSEARAIYKGLKGKYLKTFGNILPDNCKITKVGDRYTCRFEALQIPDYYAVGGTRNEVKGDSLEEVKHVAWIFLHLHEHHLC